MSGDVLTAEAAKWIGLAAIAAFAIGVRIWWDAPLFCAHPGWFCK